MNDKEIQAAISKLNFYRIVGGICYFSENLKIITREIFQNLLRGTMVNPVQSNMMQNKYMNTLYFLKNQYPTPLPDPQINGNSPFQGWKIFIGKKICLGKHFLGKNCFFSKKFFGKIFFWK